MKIKSIKNGGVAHTWDISTLQEEYLLPNGVVSHNTSAQISNSTNGVEPVRSLVSEKVSKHGILKQVVPEINRLKNKYDLLWDQESPRGYLHVMGVIQKWFDQSISVNTSYNPDHYENREISMKDMISDILFAYFIGLKNLYYNNTYDGQEDVTIVESKETTEESESSNDNIADEPCDSCVL